MTEVYKIHGEVLPRACWRLASKYTAVSFPHPDSPAETLEFFSLPYLRYLFSTEDEFNRATDQEIIMRIMRSVVSHIESRARCQHAYTLRGLTAQQQQDHLTSKCAPYASPMLQNMTADERDRMEQFICDYLVRLERNSPNAELTFLRLSLANALLLDSRHRQDQTLTLQTAHNSFFDVTDEERARGSYPAQESQYAPLMLARQGELHRSLYRACNNNEQLFSSIISRASGIVNPEVLQRILETQQLRVLERKAIERFLLDWYNRQDLQHNYLKLLKNSIDTLKEHDLPDIVATVAGSGIEEISQEDLSLIQERAAARLRDLLNTNNLTQISGELHEVTRHYGEAHLSESELRAIAKQLGILSPADVIRATPIARTVANAGIPYSGNPASDRGLEFIEHEQTIEHPHAYSELDALKQNVGETARRMYRAVVRTLWKQGRINPNDYDHTIEDFFANLCVEGLGHTSLDEVLSELRAAAHSMITHRVLTYLDGVEAVDETVVAYCNEIVRRTWQEVMGEVLPNVSYNLRGLPDIVRIANMIEVPQYAQPDSQTQLVNPIFRAAYGHAWLASSEARILVLNAMIQSTLLGRIIDPGEFHFYPFEEARSAVESIFPDREI